MTRFVILNLELPSFQAELRRLRSRDREFHRRVLVSLSKAAGMIWNDFARDFLWHTHDGGHFSNPSAWGDFTLPSMPEPVVLYAALPDGVGSGLVAPLTFWKPSLND